MRVSSIGVIELALGPSSHVTAMEEHLMLRCYGGVVDWGNDGGPGGKALFGDMGSKGSK